MLLISLLSISLLVLLLILLVDFLYLWSLLMTRSPFIPIPQERVSAIISSLGLVDGSTLYDLGCGEGRVLIGAAEVCASAKCVGVEKSPIAVFLARRACKKAGMSSRISIISGNIFSQDLSDATHVFCYLYPGMMSDLESKFTDELQHGARLVSADFPLPTKEPKEVVALVDGSPLGRKLFVYDF